MFFPYINVEIAELEARIEFLMSAITHNFKYNCFSEIYNYGIVMEEYNQKIAEMFNEALYGIDNIFNKYESDLVVGYETEVLSIAYITRRKEFIRIPVNFLISRMTTCDLHSNVLLNELHTKENFRNIFEIKS